MGEGWEGTGEGRIDGPRGGGEAGDSGPGPWSLAEAVKMGPQKGSHEEGLHLLSAQGRAGGSVQNAVQEEVELEEWGQQVELLGMRSPRERRDSETGLGGTGRRHRRESPLTCLSFSGRGENTCRLACILGGVRVGAKAADAAWVCGLPDCPSAWPGHSSPASSLSTLYRALALLRNFPGGNSPQRPSLAPHAQYILSLVPPP